ATGRRDGAAEEAEGRLMRRADRGRRADRAVAAGVPLRCFLAADQGDAEGGGRVVLDAQHAGSVVEAFRVPFAFRPDAGREAEAAADGEVDGRSRRAMVGARLFDPDGGAGRGGEGEEARGEREQRDEQGGGEVSARDRHASSTTLAADRFPGKSEPIGGRRCRRDEWRRSGSPRSRCSPGRGRVTCAPTKSWSSAISRWRSESPGWSPGRRPTPRRPPRTDSSRPTEASAASARVPRSGRGSWRSSATRRATGG